MVRANVGHWNRTGLFRGETPVLGAEDQGRALRPPLHLLFPRYPDWCPTGALHLLSASGLPDFRERHHRDAAADTLHG